jgi:DNA-binding beta-propeller fold protein YncE
MLPESSAIGRPLLSLDSRRAVSLFSAHVIKKDRRKQRSVGALLLTLLDKSSRSVGAVALALLCACSFAPPGNGSPPAPFASSLSDGFTNFETEPVRPLALSGDGRYLYALNTSDDRLEIFEAQGEKLRFLGETTVGLRPVALALRESEAWVVNHLSDSVSVVDIRNPRRPRVIRTLQVGDEPRGIALAGPKHDRVFVATARREEAFRPGVGRAQVWIFEAARPEAPPKILTLFGTKPRALAASADGRYVYAGVFFSGNGTTTVSGEDAVRLGRAPELHFDNIPYFSLPRQGAIVRRRGGWRDFQNRDWTSAVPFELPDHDVFIIDAAADTPTIVESISNVGTVLFNIAVQPGSGEIWVSNTEASNFVPHEPRLRAKFAQNRITRIYSAGGGHAAEALNLNPHIDDSAATGSQTERDLSLAQPLDLVFQPDASQAYVAAFGSKKVGVLDRAGRVVDRIAVGFGPGGLALDARRQRLYVLNHLEASLSVIDLRARKAIATVALRHDPTPAVIRQGRPFLYDASFTSAHGDLSCAICHVFGDVDGLAWDLGDPAGPTIDYPVQIRNMDPLVEPRQALHPLKGPMVTQSLRGLAGTAPYHWRGDRFGIPHAPGDDAESFNDFNPAFVALLGRAQELPEALMRSFARFVLTIRYPPNPNQQLDRRMDFEQQAGFDFFTGPFLSGSGLQNCAACHKLPIGTNRLVNFENTQVGRDMKTAHLRNIYEKVGRFNAPGPQVSGFGLLHDGTIDTVVNFLRLETFFFPGKSEKEKDRTRHFIQSYLVAFDTGMAPAVGRQLTVAGELQPAERRLLDLLISRSAAGDCDLTVKGWEEAALRGWLYRGNRFHGDRRGEPPLASQSLLDRYRRSGEPLTFTCVPPGDGLRAALDRDLDGHWDGDELLAGSDPAAAASVPSRASPLR